MAAEHLNGPRDPGRPAGAAAVWHFLRGHWLALGLSATFLLALVLRLYDLQHNPPELFEDELAGAASAWSIVTTGHDVGRTVLPFLTTRLELKQPIYGYATVPFQLVLGHDTLAVRLPAVIFGVATVGLTAWLLRVLGRNRVEQLLAALFMAIVPWSVHLGRVGWEPASALPFVVGGTALLWSGMARRSTRRIVVSAIVLAVGAYTYQPALLVDVLLAAWAAVVWWGDRGRAQLRALAIGAACALVILVPYLLALRDPLFLQRAETISSFAHGLNPADIGLAWTNYWAQWNPQYLFLQGTANLRNEPDMGVLFPWLAPLLVVGALRLLWRRDRADVFLFGWLLLGAVPAGLTNDGVPHFLRGLAALPAIIAASTTGALWLWELLAQVPPREIARSLVVSLWLVLAIQETAGAAVFYYRDYPAASASSWYYGTGEALTLAQSRVPAGGRLCIETPSISYWTFPQYVAWYLRGIPFQVVEGTSDPRCSMSGTYVLEHVGSNPPAPATLVATVPDYSGNPLFKLLRVGDSG